MLPAHIGPYRILQALGEGGMGAVYEALHESIERRVALKVLHPEFARNPDAVSRFFNEARAVNRIEHPNIVQISEFGHADNGTVYLVMEFLRGTTLSERLKTLAAAGRCMQPVEVVQIGAQLADALAAAHEKGIIHRDLKPGNVMLVKDALAPCGERVKLLDFGIAKLTQNPGGQATKTNALIGTPAYMSPEQCRGAAGVDDRTDVYALGVMLYEMLAGRPPFVAEDTLGYLTQHAYEQPKELASLVPNVPPEILRLVHRLLSKDKNTRPAMQEVRAELIRLLATLSAATQAAMEPPPPLAAEKIASPFLPTTLGGSLGQALPRRRTALFTAAMLCFLGIVGSARHLLLSPAKSPPPASVAQPAPRRPASPLHTEPPAQTEPQKSSEPPVHSEFVPKAEPDSKPLAPRETSPVTDSPHPPLPGARPHRAKPAKSPSPPAPPKAPRKYVD